MRRIVLGLLGGTMLAAASPAIAADIAVPYVPVAPVAVAIQGNWYLRGDVGFAFERGRYREQEFDGPGGTWLHQTTGDAGIVGAGIGYTFNHYLRGDLTAEFRTAVSIRGMGRQVVGAFAGVSQVEAQVSSGVVLANVYADLGTRWGITPYVGAGLGVAYNYIAGGSQHSMIDVGAGASPAMGQYGQRGQFAFAWALHAGAAYDVSDRMKIDFGYRYLDQGEAVSGSLYGFNGANFSKNKFPDRLSVDLTSHDFRIGMRYLLDAPASAPAPSYAYPVVAKN